MVADSDPQFNWRDNDQDAAVGVMSAIFGDLLHARSSLNNGSRG